MTHPPSGPSTPPPPPGPKDYPRNRFEAAAELGVSESWLRKAVTARRVPFHMLGRVIVFYDNDIADIKAMSRVVPKPAPVARIAQGRRVA